MGRLHQDDVRAKIQVSQLLNVLTDQALGGGEDLSAARLKAIEILLRKSLPDLSAIQVDEGGKDGPSVADVVRSFNERRASDTDVQG
jgi:hypothetical protein